MAWKNWSNNDYATVAIHGIWQIAVKSNTYSPGEYIRTSSNNGIGEETSQRKGCYAQIGEGVTVNSDGDTIAAWLMHVEMD